MQEPSRHKSAPEHSNKATSRGGSNLAAWLTLVIGAVLLFVIATHRQGIYDWWVLRDYKPSSQVTKLADQTSLTDSARRVFYVNKPEILGRKSFNKTCPDRGGEQTIILGCYHSGQHGIYLYDMTDDRLNGVEQVTAAHELLHAGYDRLSSAQRQRINNMLMDYYDNKLTDQRVKDTIAAYKKSEPADVINEMHSVFGSELAKLTPDLEAYYARYFTDRQAIVHYAENYQNEFTSRKDRVAAYDKQLAVTKSEINQKQTFLTKENAKLIAERSEIDETNPADNYAAYNQKVASYNQNVSSYNVEIAQLKTLVRQHNRMIDSRNSIALEVQSLSQAINSHLEKL